MTNSQIIHIEGIGPVLFEKSRRARRVIISVGSSKGVRVAVPARTSLAQAQEFVLRKQDWVRKHLAKVAQDESLRQALLDRYLSLDKPAAKRKLIERLLRLAEEHGFTVNRVSVREQRTRWGSCSTKGNISLNLKLVLLPPELIDYVMLHELVHTRIHNHSRKFWAELDRYTGNGKAMSRQLRGHAVGLL